ncbi:MAG: nitroreductase family protein [archaeon]|nr:nitroreductase family protein [archaeon]
MEMLELIKTRRSIRRYKKESVPEDSVKQILEAGRWAPSASNSQPWEFIILRDGKIKEEVAKATTYGKFLADAPLGIAVVIDPKAPAGRLRRLHLPTRMEENHSKSLFRSLFPFDFHDPGKELPTEIR